MKLFIISPNIDRAFSDQQKSQLQAAGETVFIKDIKPWQDVAELYLGNEPRIVAIDPDFCDWQVPNDVLDRIPNLQAVCLQTTSFSWIEVDHLRERGIPVTNLRGFSSIAVAEWVTLITLALARRVPVAMQDNWELNYEKHRGMELRGKTAGVIGLGHIGTAVAENLAGLGMHVQYWSKNTRDKRFSTVGLETLMQTSDVIVPAVAYNSETATLINDDMLRTMKPTALLVGVTHPVYNQELLLQLAAQDAIGGYGFEDEKGHFGAKAYQGNVWNGPALGWCTNESMAGNTKQWVESIITAAKGEFPTQINA